MKMPRNIDGDELASRLLRYGIISRIRLAAISDSPWRKTERFTT